MEPADLLDYALGRLDGPRREWLERELERDPTLAGRMVRLIQNLGRLLDDGRPRPSSRRRQPSPQAPSASPTSHSLVEQASPEDEPGRSPVDLP